ncbi:galanin receptor type 1-like [Patiria miniata]|uniref:G-protein coupled receptors family 1 profile domain-containing protein n=1 Tax=Patiria miniata TaxID=46514 RepID=A0A914AZD8_PATMI|nr:galanin receptor type 1-like [Patiria miniata]
MSSDYQKGIMMDFNNATNNYLIQNPLTPQLVAVFTIIACLAVLGNGLVITVMLLRRRVFSSFTNRLILHQSAIDCVTGVVFFVWRVVLQIIQKPVFFEGNIIYAQLICRFITVDYFVWCMNVTSTYNLVIISLERFMATCHPVKHRNTWTSVKLKFAMGTAWAIGFMYGSHFAFLFEVNEGHCQPTELETSLKVFEISATITIEYLVPTTILIYTYSRIFMKLTKKSANPVHGARNTTNKAKKNVLVTTMLIGIMFVLCWTPIEVVYLYQQLSGDWSTPLYDIFTSLVACNMLVNPVIYCFKYEKFRSELRKLVLKRCRRNQVEDENTISMSAASSRMNTNLMQNGQSS